MVDTSNPNDDSDPRAVSVEETLKRVLHWESECLAIMAGRVGPPMAEAVDILASTHGRIIVTGMGKMGLVGRKAAATFSSTGSPAIFLHPSEAMHGDLGIVDSEDVLLVLSNSGETEELLALLPYLLRFGVKVIALTGRTQSTLASRSRLVIDISVEREADEISSAPTASTIVAMGVCDAIAVALMRRRGFTREQFAIFHPGGNLGRKMLTTVGEVMKTEERVPLVHADLHLREAIVEMSAKGLGCVFVVSSDGRLAGIFTDGDLRRTLERHENPLSHRIGEYMVRAPKSIVADMLAAEALRLMEQHSITVLPVLNESERPVGALHLHDLIQLGLA
jgi:arabinose-5-phosphate isomerase